MQVKHNNARTKSIEEIYREKFGSKVDNTKLHDSLQYVSNWAAQPAPFRNTFYNELSSKQKDLFQDKLVKVLEIFLEIHDRPLPDSNNPIEHTTIHMLYLFNFLEAIICAPDPTRSTSLNNLFQTRLQKLNTGDFKSLFIDAFKIQNSNQPTQHQPTIQQKSKKIMKAINDDNFGKASRQISPSPVAQLNEEKIEALKKLYPNKITNTYSTASPHHNTRSRSKCQPASQNMSQSTHETTNSDNSEDNEETQSTHIPLHLQNHTVDSINAEFEKLTDTDRILLSVSYLQKGKATGPAAESTDCLKRLFNTKVQGKLIHLPKLIRLIDIILARELPPEFEKFFTSSTLTALHKDPENNPLNLRPIGVGGVLRRFTSSLIAHNTQFADYLLPLQWGVGVKGGMNHIIHTAQILTEKYIDRETSDMRNNPPTRCLLLLDFKNMFNNCSRDVALKKIEILYPHLLPFVKTLYDNSTIVWVKKEDGTMTKIYQLEGFAQGCPLAPILSAIVLQELLIPLQKELDKRALARKQDPTFQDDDNNGSATNVMAYLDDTTAATTLDDAEFIIDYMETHGPPLGCILRPDKCKILTSTNGTSPKLFLTDKQQQTLTRLTTKLTTKAELTNGVRLLGTPIGNQNFIINFLTSTLTKIEGFQNNATELITDPHAQLLFFKQCIESKSTHLQMASLLTPESVTQITTETTFALKSNQLAQQLLANVMNLPINTALPEHSWLVASTPVGKGGLGIRDSTNEACISFFCSILRSIRYATDKITFKDGTEIILPTHHKDLYADWQTSNTRIFTTFRSILNNLLPFITCPDEIISQQQKISYVMTEIKLEGLQRKIKRNLASEKIQKYLEDVTKPDDIRINLPSMLSGTTISGTMNISRTIPHNRPNPKFFRLALHRMLRTPIPILYNKTCCQNCKNNNNTNIDKYGDHIIACHSKTAAHNEIRDSLATIIRNTATITNDIPTENHISLEPVGLTPSHPLKRPADILLYLSDNEQTKTTKIAIDTTFIGTNSRSTAELEVSRSLMTDKVFRHHEAAENKKFKGPNRPGTPGDHIIKELNDNNCRILPATFDSFGKLGPAITDFLYGPNNEYKTFKRNTETLHAHAKQAIKIATEKNRVHSLLTRANVDWTTKNGKTSWYTTSYKAKTPSMWAKQYLCISMINALGKHLHQGIAKALLQTKNTSKLNTAGTRQDYLSSKHRESASNASPPTKQPAPRSKTTTTQQLHNRNTDRDTVGREWRRAVPLDNNSQHTRAHTTRPPSTTHPASQQTSTTRPNGQINQNNQ